MTSRSVFSLRGSPSYGRNKCGVVSLIKSICRGRGGWLAGWWGVRAGASIHLLLRAAQVAALDSDLDHANLPVAFTGRGRQADIERLASREAGDDRGVREGAGAGAAAPEELTGQYNKSSHAAILFIKAA